MTDQRPGPDEDAEAAWAKELEKRVRELDEGIEKPIRWEKARRMILDDQGDADG